MKYSLSGDGELRTSVQIIVRLTKGDVEEIRAYLKRRGAPSSNSDIREFVKDWTEFNPPSMEGRDE